MIEYYTGETFGRFTCVGAWNEYELVWLGYYVSEYVMNRAEILMP